ncbi:MAG: hypothetical protein C3F08_08155 [Candidatus Methylomirabilota bacterium]|nr:MAG: hypothetical protein C3F08_08155 [candidate division NC10 bacterium]
MVIADTSLWIEYFKGGDEPARAALRKLIRTEQVVLVGVVLAELLQGCRSSHEAHTIISNLTALPFLEAGFSTWKRAGELSASLQQKGVTLPPLRPHHRRSCLGTSVSGVYVRCPRQTHSRPETVRATTFVGGAISLSPTSL